MKKYKLEIIQLLTLKNKNLKATFYRPIDTEIKATILYFHGGGLIFGNRNDLPEKYLDLLTANGIALFAVDYPLAPETKMPEILDTVFKMTHYFVHQFLNTLQVEKYFIMGRSAGGFLTLSAGLKAKKFKNKPRGLISLYGYYNLNDALFSAPNRHYLKYPKVNDHIISSIAHIEPVVTTGDQNRFLLYLSARQKGDWINLILSSSNQKKTFSLGNEQIGSLAPLFLAAAKADPDIPSQQSKQLASFHPNAEIAIYNLKEHDFDRTHQETFGIELYKKMLAWILEKI